MIFTRKIKATELIEQERLQLWNDFQTYKTVEKSEELKIYLALKEKVESIPFQEKKKEIESLRFKNSPEEKMVKEFSKLEKNGKLIRYFETQSSADLERFNEITKSGDLERLKELEHFVKSGQYKKELIAFKKMKKADKENKEVWEKTDSFLKKKSYEDLRSSPNVLFYKRFKKSKAYRNYLVINDSAMYNQYDDLKAAVNSDRFKTRKAYLQDFKRYEKTEDFKLLTQFQQLDANKEIQLYLKYNDTDAFKFFREWKPTFEDDFKTIDKNKWSFISPLAQKGPGVNFSFKKQLHYANNSDNIEVENSILTLETKREKASGIYWNEQFGFVNREFDYVSGIAHSLNNFNQQYGHFEIKMKVSKVKGVISSVSLVDESEENCIRIFTSNGSLTQGGLVKTDHLQKIFTPIKLSLPSKGYVLIAITWTPEKIEWSVNDKEAGSITHSIPHIPLGIRIESEVIKETSNLPHRLDIDWIKCYSRN